MKSNHNYMSKYRVHPNKCNCKNCRRNYKRNNCEGKIVSFMVLGLIIIIIVIVSII